MTLSAMRLWTLAAAVAAAALSACGDDAGTAGSGGTAGAGGGAGGAGGAAGATSSGTAGAGPCGGDTCAANEFCADPQSACGAGTLVVDPEGTEVKASCAERPAMCGGGAMACGCDGQVYDNVCVAAQNGQGITFEGCSTPPGTFPCGEFFCDPAVSYCDVSFPIQDFGRTLYACLPFPDLCTQVPPSDCQCIIDALSAPCLDEPADCTQTGGGFTVSCVKN